MENGAVGEVSTLSVAVSRRLRGKVAPRGMRKAAFER